MIAPSFLLDTNICIYIRRRSSAQALARFKSLAAGEAGISVVTYGELRVGVEKSPDPDRAEEVLRELIEELPVAPLPEEAGYSYGALRAALEISGQMIGPNDLWIAAHALAANLTLVTNKSSVK